MGHWAHRKTQTQRSNWEIKIPGLGKGELRRLPLTFPWIVYWGEFWSPGEHLSDQEQRKAKQRLSVDVLFDLKIQFMNSQSFGPSLAQMKIKYTKP